MTTLTIFLKKTSLKTNLEKSYSLLYESNEYAKRGKLS